MEAANGAQQLEGKPPLYNGQEDDRVYWDKQEQKWCLEDEHGASFQYSEAVKTWIPLADDEQIAAQQAAYSVAGVDESAPTAAIDKKRKREKPSKEDKAALKQKQKEEKASRNTAIYVTGLPLPPCPPANVDEIQQVFSKAGIILQDAEGKYKIKLYSNPDGSTKGEALIVYLQEASADLAVTWFHETELRIGKANEEGLMSVTRANFDHKDKNATKEPPAKKQRADPKKQKAAKKAENLKKRLEGWESDDELQAKREAKQQHLQSKIVVLTNMFTLAKLEEDPTLLLDLKEDVREECEESFGKVTNVVLYDQEPEGIMTVRFTEESAAEACIKKMKGRFFDGRVVSAYLSDGKNKFQKSSRADNQAFGEEADQADQQRLAAYAAYLERS